MKLTDAQLIAAVSSKRLLLIEAEPGSGKTTTLVERAGLLNAARPHGDPKGILCISFTRSAVEEIRRRTTSRWGSALRCVPNRVMTIDGLFRWVWGQLISSGEIDWFGLSANQVLEPEDSWGKTGKRIERNSERLTIGLKGRSTVLRIVNTERRTQGFRPVAGDTYLRQLESGRSTHDEVRACIRDVLLQDWGKAFIGQALSERFGHVLVDEAFDCNRDDRKLLSRFVDEQTPMTFVGDQWQAIYDWRGGDPAELRKWCKGLGFYSGDTLHALRFQTDELRKFCGSLRTSNAVSFQGFLRPHDTLSHTAIARSWEHVWVPEVPHILPLAIVSPYGLSIPYCVATLILDIATRRMVGLRALGLREAVNSLLLPSDFRLDMGSLEEITAKAAYSEAQLQIERATGTLPAASTSAVDRRLGQLWHRLRLKTSLCPGITVHQAKGNEWQSVEFVADANDLRAMRNGFSWDNPDDRIRYVGLTRARESLHINPIPYRDQANRQGLTKL